MFGGKRPKPAQAFRLKVTKQEAIPGVLLDDLIPYPFYMTPQTLRKHLM